MAQRILRYINYILASTLLLLVLFVIVMIVKGHRHVEAAPSLAAIEKAPAVIKNSFEQSANAYDDISNPVLSTSIVSPTLELPDLRPFLNYYGTNDRPDIAANATLIYFSLKGSDQVVGVVPGERLYLKYDASKRPGTYIFSPDNQPTNLWIVADKDEGKSAVRVVMTDDSGKEVTEPAIRANFSLTAKDFARPGGAWEIGKWKVDGTLLARQRARWFGQDQFLNQHGGDEFAEQRDRERIEFGEGNDRYVVYVKAGDCLVWDGQRWQKAHPGEASRPYPLMCVHKVDDRLMRLDLWDVGGQGHVSLNLIKSKEAWAPKTYELDFKFVSARTLSQYVFEVKKERMVLRPWDWLLLTDKGWKPLVSVEDIDAYVDRKTPGVLFVFQGPIQADEKQVLRGTFYSPSRTEIYDLDFPMDQTSPILGTPRNEEKASQPNQEEQATPPNSNEEQSSFPQESSQGQFEQGQENNQPYSFAPPLVPTKEQPNPHEPSTWVRPEAKTLKMNEEVHPHTDNPDEAPLVPWKRPTEEQQQDQDGQEPQQQLPESSDQDQSSATLPVTNRGDHAIVETRKVRKAARQPGRLKKDIKFLLQDISE